ncbi:MAG: SufD family Fe-S cluster assembly protein [Mycoplasmataceae bacterium]|jgi:Fe-S cluster assembly protein SufD|nr:SufD family Fe-S cluster assembly protein [Mycoplasmataceae bacterium]
MQDKKIIDDFFDNNTNQELVFDVKKDSTLTVALNIKAKNNQKIYNIIFNHKENSSVFIKVNCLTFIKGEIVVNITNNVPKNTPHCCVSQKIIGVLTTKNSSIKATPIMNVYNNQVNAEHEVNVGYLNKEEIFYLMSKGVKKSKATKILIDNLFAI